MKRRVEWSDSTRKMRPFVLVLMVALVVLAILPAMALAATDTWTNGAGTGVWSIGPNWSGLIPPITGHDLAFPANVLGASTNDLSLATYGAVDVSGSIVVDGLPLAMTGPLSAHQSPAWDVDTYLAGDLVVSETPAATPAPMTIGGTLDMNNELYDPDGYKLTFNVASLGSIRDSGSIIGPVARCSLTKTGAGDLRLGWGGADATPWTGSNTWGGPTDVQAGSLTLWNPGALAQGNDLTIASGATVAAHYAVAGHTADVWDNPIHGSGNLNVDAGALTIRGDGGEFTGTTTVGPGTQLTVGDIGWTVLYGTTNVQGGAVLRGVGGVDTLAIADGGEVSPGANNYDVGMLMPNSSASLAQGASYTVDVGDVNNGPIYGWDFLQTGDTGTVAITATPAHPFTIKLRSSSGGAAGHAANFDKGVEYHWSIIWAGGGFTGFDPHAFTIDATAFTNDVGDGQFTVEESGDGTSIDVVFSPVQAPVISSCSLPATLGEASWSNVTPATWTVQAVDPQDDAMTLNYKIDGGDTVYTAPLSGSPRTATGSSALEGTHSVDIWVTDVYGYASDHVTGYFKLDTVAPTTAESTSYLKSSSAVWTNVDLASPNGPATLTATDATSGVASTQYKVKSGGSWSSPLSFAPITITDQNTHDIEFWATDNAGNTAVHKTKYYNLDKTNPVLTFDAHNPYYGTTGVTFGWSATDNVASISDLRYQYKLVAPGQTESGVPYNADNTDLTKTYGTVGSPLAVGVYSFYCRVRDTAGNWDTKSFSFEVKTFTLTPSSGSNGTVTPTGVQTVDYGASQTFTITPAAHYHVADVLVDGSSVGAVTTRTFSNVTANHTISATFAIDTYAITPSSGSNGTVTPTGVQNVDWGTNKTFTITPNAHYHVANVLVDGSSVGAVTSYTFTNVTATHTISATFAIDTFTLTPSAGSNGAVTPTGVQTVDYGTNKTFTITPNAHYHVVDVLVDGSSVGAVTSYTFSSVSANHTISATFAIDTYTLTPSSGSNGTVTPTGVQTVDYGTNKTFTITPNAHYHVVDVLVDGSSVGAVTSYTFSSVSANHTISATFAIDTYTITPSAGSNGSISPSGVQTVNWNASQTFTITPNAHYHVANVLVDGSSVGAVTSYTFSSVSANHTISATFAIDTYTITPSAGSNGSISPSGVQTVNWNASQTFTITPNAHYHVANVLVDGSSVGAVTSYTFTNVTATHTISATFAIDTFTLTPSAGSNGAVTPTGVQTVDYGTNKTFTITPNAHYHVVDVLVDGSSVGAVTSYTFSSVSANHTISATFAIDTYTITPSAGSNGSISPSGVQTVNWNASQTFTITPATHYHIADVFVDGASVGAVTSYAFTNVTATHTISATFASDTNTITPSAGSNGAVTPSGVQTVDYGTNKTFTITPSAHYHVADVLVDGSSVGAVTSYTFTNVVANHTISATFAIDTYTITPSAGSNGSISPATAQIVSYGGSQAFTITADARYHVADVLVDGVSVGAVTSYTFASVGASHTIAASFAPDLIVIASPNGGETWNRLANHAVTWHLSSPVSSGYFRIWLRVGGVNYEQTVSPYVAAVPGQSDYSFTKYISRAASTGYTTLIQYYLADGTYQARDYGDATFTIVEPPLTITPTAGANGSISPTGAQTVAYGGSQAFTITPDAHYHVADVLVDGVSVGAVSSYSFTNVIANHSIAASFAIDTYAITPTAGASGSLSPTGAQTVNYGGSKTFTITPDAHYHVADVLVDGVSVGAVTSYTFDSVSANHIISASFAIDTYTITPTAGANGSVSPATDQTVPWGADQDLTITPNAHYHVADVLVDGVSVGAVTSYTFHSVTGDHSISATFAIDTYTITPSAGTGGSVSPSGARTVDYGGSQVLTITADAHYHVADVLVDGVSVGAVTSYTFANVHASHTITASFAQTDFLVVKSPNGGETWNRLENHAFTWRLSSPVSSGYFRIWLRLGGVSYEQTVSPYVAAVPGQTDYSFTKYISRAANTGYTARIQYYLSNGTYQARGDSDAAFTIVEPPITITPTAGANGSISPASVQTVTSGSNKSFTIAPDAHYRVADVLVDGVSVGAVTSYTFTNITASHTIAASFAIDTYTITPSAGANGSISPAVAQTVNYGGSQAFTITPAAHYHVADVLVDGVSVGAVASYTFDNVGANHTISASFAQSDFLVVTSPRGGETWNRLESHDFTWRLNSPVSTGYFRLWLRLGGTNYEQTTSSTWVQAVPGQTDYSFAKYFSQAAGSGYVARIQYYLADGTYQTRGDSDAAFTIAEPPLSITPTTPAGGEAWARLTSQTFTWKLNRPMSSGYFRIWLRANGVNYEQTTASAVVAAVTGRTSYSFAKTISVAAGAGYSARIQYYLDDGTYQVRGDSAATFTVVDPPLMVASPSGGEIWTRLTSQTFTWTMNPAVSTGYFRIWLRASGVNYEQTTSSTWVQAVPDQTSYSFTRTISQAAGTGYVARVQYYLNNGTFQMGDDSDAAFTIAP